MKAWHFVGATLRNGELIPRDGERFSVKPPLIICEHGLHASVRLIDALQYAPGHTICRVECSGEIIHEDHKLVAEHRTILWRVDGKELLRRFTRKCALDVLHLWNAPEVVRQYLKTGDEKIRDAARAAAWTATGAAAGAAARAAAWTAARAAAEAAAWTAARAAAAAAARDVAGAAARDAQNKRFTAMVMKAHRAA